MNTQDVERFVNSQYVTAIVTGLVLGALAAWLASRFVRHKPGDRGSDYNRRVGWWALSSGFLALILGCVVILVLAMVAPFEALAPMDRAGLVAGYSLQTLAPVAALAALVTFAVTAGFIPWAGQRTLAPRG